MSHRGPIQSYTEVCLACMHNTYMTDICDPELGRKDIEQQEIKAKARADYLRAAQDKASKEFEEWWAKR